MIVRKAKLKDVDEITNLNYLLMRYHVKFDKYHKVNKHHRKIYNKFAKRLIRSKNALFLVAEVNGKLVGTTYGEIRKRPPIMEVLKYGHLGDVFVLKEYRNQGIGKKLTKEVMKWFKSKRIKFVELSVDVRNKVGLKAWERLGFKPFMLKMKKTVK